MPINTQVVVPAQVKLPSSLSADGIRAVVTGTAGAGKPIVDDNAGGLEWGTPVGAPAIADITDWPSGLNATELGYVNGVTSAIQTQLDAKQATLNSTNKLGLAAGGSNADLSATGGATHFLRQASTGAAVTVGAIGASDLPTGIDAAKLHDGSIGNTDLVCIKDLATTGGAGHFLKQNSVGGPITSAVPTASPQFVGYCGYKTTAQTISTGTITKITWPLEFIAPTSLLASPDVTHSTGSNQGDHIIGITGKWRVSARIKTRATGSGSTWVVTSLLIYVNDASLAPIEDDGAVYDASGIALGYISPPLGVDFVRSFTAGDTLDLRVYNASFGFNIEFSSIVLQYLGA